MSRADYGTREWLNLHTTILRLSNDGLSRGAIVRQSGASYGTITRHLNDKRPLYSLPENHKLCQRCGIAKPLGDFNDNRSRRDGKQHYCRECFAAYIKENPFPGRVAFVKRTYGLQREQYEHLLADQGNACAICGIPTPGTQTWNVDHDHSCCSGNRSCGKCVRGLLCKKCNMGLGSFTDAPELLLRAAAYVLFHDARQGGVDASQSEQFRDIAKLVA